MVEERSYLDLKHTRNSLSERARGVGAGRVDSWLCSLLDPLMDRQCNVPGRRAQHFRMLKKRRRPVLGPGIGMGRPVAMSRRHGLSSLPTWLLKATTTLPQRRREAGTRRLGPQRAEATAVSGESPERGQPGTSPKTNLADGPTKAEEGLPWPIPPGCSGAMWELSPDLLPWVSPPTPPGDQPALGPCPLHRQPWPLLLGLPHRHLGGGLKRGWLWCLPLHTLLSTGKANPAAHELSFGVGRGRAGVSGPGEERRATRPRLTRAPMRL